MNTIFETTSPAEKLRLYVGMLSLYRDARKAHADFVALSGRESTAASLEANLDRINQLSREVDEVARAVAAQGLVLLADGLFGRCAEILEVETAGRL